MQTRPVRPKAYMLDPGFAWEELNPDKHLGIWRSECWSKGVEYQTTQEWKNALEYVQRKRATYEISLAAWQEEHPELEQLYQDALGLKKTRINLEEAEDYVQRVREVVKYLRATLETHEGLVVKLQKNIQQLKNKHANLERLADEVEFE